MLQKKYVNLFLFCVVLCADSVTAMHNSNRYFSFFERPSGHTFPDMTSFTPSTFITSAHRAGNDRLNQNISIARLWGQYNLQTLFSNMKLYKNFLGESYSDPFITTGHPDWEDRSIVFDIKGRVLSRGFSLAGEQRLNKFFSLGASFPFMEVISHHRFVLNNPLTVTGSTLTDADSADLDFIRRSLQDQIGLEAPDFSRWLTGDLDVFLRSFKKWDHQLLMRSIFMNIRGGCLFPTGSRRMKNNPASLPAMSNGHVGIYLDVNPEFELKQNLFVGFVAGIEKAFPRTVNDRVPITPFLLEDEINQNRDLPFFYSPASGKVRHYKGLTFKIAPYITFANLVDGLNFHLRWDYVYHAKDSYVDYRSYEEKTRIPTNFRTMKKFSFFSMSEGTFEFEYDSKKGLKKWPLQPTIRLSYSMPLGSQDNATQQHQFNLGVEFHF